MLEILGDASGILVAAAILFAARELRRISDALRDLDVRVSRLEFWLQRGFALLPRISNLLMGLLLVGSLQGSYCSSPIFHFWDSL